MKTKHRSSIRIVPTLILASLPALSACQGLDGVNRETALFDANQCLSGRASVVGLSDTAMAISGNGQIGGGVLLLGNSTLQLSGRAKITQAIYAPSANVVQKSGKNAVGQVIEADFTPNESAALSFIDQLAQLSATETRGGIDDSVTLQGKGGTNVIDVQGGLQLSGKSQLTLVGDSSELFLVRVNGDVAFSGQAGVKLEGISPRNVLFLMVGEGSKLSISGQGMIVGTFVSTRGSASISGNGRIQGAVLAQGSIRISGNGLSFDAAPFCPGAWIAPEPTASPTPSSSPSPEPSTTPSSSPSPEPSSTPSPEPSTGTDTGTDSGTDAGTGTGTDGSTGSGTGTGSGSECVGLSCGGGIIGL